MRRMCTAPVIVGRERKDTDQAAGPVIRLAVSKEGAVTAIVLDHEQAKQEACGRDDQHEAPPEPMMRRVRGRRPKANKRDERHRQFEQAARPMGFPIAGQIFGQARSPTSGGEMDAAALVSNNSQASTDSGCRGAGETAYLLIDLSPIGTQHAG